MKKNICIIYPNKSSSSETFIQQHINHLPCTVFKLYGGWFPSYTGDDVELLNYAGINENDLLKKIKKKIRIPERYTSEALHKKALFNFLKVHKIDAVLAEYGLTGTAVMDVCELAQVPLIVHFHGFDAYNKSVLAGQLDQYQILFEKAAKIVAVSNAMLQQLIRLGAPVNKLTLNPCGVDVNKFFIGEKKITSPVFLFTGRFVNKKGPHLLITCFSKVLQEIPAAKLIMIGDGGAGSCQELYNGCWELVKGLKIEAAVAFKGSCSGEEVAAYMKEAVIFVQHSVTTETGDSEGTPVSLLEASASGLAVIGTKHGGIEDVIIHDQTGFIVDEYDLENTIAYMILLAKNLPLAHSMGLRARQRMIENYSMEISIEKLWNIITEATKKQPV
jgi:colanic acid/amylovoran biosynthesis glycosyltransferase